MAPEVSIIPHVESVADFKKGLKDWTPKSDQEAAQLIALISILNSTGGDAAKKAAYARLARKCEDCDVLEFDGFNLKAIRKTPREYGDPSPKLLALQAKKAKLQEQLKAVDIDIKAEVEKSPFTEGKPMFSHWLVQ